MILRWGKQLERPRGIVQNEHSYNRNDEVVEKEVSTSSNDVIGNDARNANKIPNDPKKISPRPYVPPLPFPRRMAKAKIDQQFRNCLEVLQKLYINIQLTNALPQMPSYAEFLKEILSNKRKLEEDELMALIEKCSAAIQNKLPVKLKDHDNFSTPFVIENMLIDCALFDLESSVSLMSSSLYKKLDLV